MKTLLVVILSAVVVCSPAYAVKNAKVKFVKLTDGDPVGVPLSDKIFAKLKGEVRPAISYNGKTCNVVTIDGYICKCNDAVYTFKKASLIKYSDVQDDSNSSVGKVKSIFEDSCAYLCVELPYPDKGGYTCLLYREDKFSDIMTLCQPN